VIRVRRVSLEDPTGKASPVHAPSPWRHALVTATPRKRYTTQTLRSGASGCRARRTGIGWISVRRSGSPPPPHLVLGEAGWKPIGEEEGLPFQGAVEGFPSRKEGPGPSPATPGWPTGSRTGATRGTRLLKPPPPPRGRGGVSGRDLPKRNRRCPHPVGTQKQTKKPGPSH